VSRVLRQRRGGACRTFWRVQGEDRRMHRTGEEVRVRTKFDDQRTVVTVVAYICSRRTFEQRFRFAPAGLLFIRERFSNMQGKRSKRRRAEEEEGPSKRQQTEEAAAKRAPALLSWMRNAEPIDPARDAGVEEVESLGGRLQAALRAGGVERLFPTQLAVWEALAGGCSDAHDVCLHAPTGSGKTLAYALPLVCALRGRVIRRLRALVVLPTHDLAQQARAAAAPGAPRAHQSPFRWASSCAPFARRWGLQSPSSPARAH